MIDKLVLSQTVNVWGFKPTYTALDIIVKDDNEALLSNEESKQQALSALLIISIYVNLSLIIPEIINHFMLDNDNQVLDSSTAFAP